MSTARQRRDATARDWVALVVAIVFLNAAFTLENVWPTLGVQLAPRLSLELCVLLAAIVAWAAAFGAPGRKTVSLWTLVALVLAIARYAQETTAALYGRPIDFFWDARYLPNVAAMLAEVASPWLVVALVAGVVAVLVLLFVLFRFAMGRVALAAREPLQRRALNIVALLGVSAFLLLRVAGAPVGLLYAEPVTPGIARQADLVVDGLRGAPAPLENAAFPVSDLGNVAGADVVVVFLESYGAVTYDDARIAAEVGPKRAAFAAAASAAGANRHVVSAFVESPTFGGGSWLAHSSLLAGLTVRTQNAYLRVLASERTTLARQFAAAGYRTTAWFPGLRGAWPEGEFYGFDEIVGAPELDYRGPAFGWWRVPDQYVLAKLEARERAQPLSERAPLFAVVATISTHIPYRPVPPLAHGWERLLSAEPFAADDVAAALAVPPRWFDLGEAYAATFAYTFDYLAEYLRRLREDDDFVLVLVGDHQPQAGVTGRRARWDVPVHVVTSRGAVAQALIAAGFVRGVELAGEEHVGSMADLTGILLGAFDSQANSRAPRKRGGAERLAWVP